MSQQDNFAGGFFTGAVVGGIIGGIIGALATAKIKGSGGNNGDEGELRLDEATEASMESARRGLEDKIAQLNFAIDDVRQQLGGVNGHSEDPDYDRPANGEPSA